MNFYAASKPVDVQAMALPVSEESKLGLFNFMVQVQYENDSLGQLTYTSFGGPHVPREKLEMFCGDKYIELTDFKKLGVNGKTSSIGGGMGHARELDVFHETIRRHQTPSDLDSNMAASWIALEANG